MQFGPMFVSTFAALLTLTSSAVADAADAADATSAINPGQLIIMPVAGAGIDIKSPSDKSYAANEAKGPSTTWRGLHVLKHDFISGAMLVSVPVGTELAAAAAWTAQPDVRFAEPNSTSMRAGGFLAPPNDALDGPPNDTHFESQWNLHNTGQQGGTPDADIDVLGAWSLTTGDPDVVIAVIDSGVNFAHPDLIGRLMQGGFDFVDFDSDPSDLNGVGTRVAGVIAANWNNDFALAGVDPSALILPLRVFDENATGTPFETAQAINFCAARDDVDIISMSIVSSSQSQLVTEALENARNAGQILIACAGNGGIGNADVSMPGASPFTLSIGATRRDDGRANFSGTGAALDFVAPSDFVPTLPWNFGVDNFDVTSGCGIATPMVAGIVSLMVAEANAAGVTLTHDEVRALLVQAAIDEIGTPFQDQPGRDDFFGHGRVNARLAILATRAFITSCPADIDGSTAVDFGDLLTLLSCFGNSDEACLALDLAGDDNLVTFEDLLALLSAWGPCPKL
ncbi:MAG: S8 family serine peptidase [Phycisphaerales bacterium]